MVHFCAACWNEIDETAEACPVCGANQAALREEPFVQKLIRALHHPEPETPIRAATVLGKLRAHEAVEELIQLMSTSPDPYIAAACAGALGAIGGPRALGALHAVLTDRSSVPLRRAAENALRNGRKDLSTDA